MISPGVTNLVTDVPTMMDAMVIDALGGLEKLHLAQIPVPATGADEVLVRVRAAGVGIWDVKLRSGEMPRKNPHFPMVLGVECSGEVVRCGSSVKRDDLQPGAGVYTYFNGPQGAYAQFVNVKTDAVEAKPKRLSFVEAAAVPVDALTAYQGIAEHLQLKPGETILIAGAAGGVGMMAVQLARNIGANVVASVGKDDFDYARSLGARDVVDYAAGNVADAVRRIHPEGVDVAFDCVGGKNAQITIDAVRDGGRFVELTAEDVGRPRNIDVGHVQSEGTSGRLRLLARMFDDQSLRVVIDRAYPLAEAQSAQARVAGQHGHGKVVLDLTS